MVADVPWESLSMIQRRIVGAVLTVVFSTFLAAPASRADFIIITNSGPGTAQNITAAGVVTAHSSGYSSPTGQIALNPSGTMLYVANTGGNSVSSVAASGGTPSTFISNL